MKFSANWLNEYLKKSLKTETIAELLTMGIFEVENTEKMNDDWMLDIKVLPNRAHDCLAHLGIAREIAALADIKFSEPAIDIKEDKSLKIKDFLSVEVKEKNLCSRYSARVMIDVTVGQSPQWLQDRLKVCGLRPINNIVDITNYVMLETGQPLHAFDLDKLDTNTRMNTNDTNKKTIIVRKAEKGEKIITLDEGRAQRELNENILVIADEDKAIGIAGIKGGRGPEIDGKTTRIALEAAKFDPLNIRKSSKTLALRTDASWRFENDPDINLTVKALDRAVSLIGQLAGGRIVSGMIDVALRKQAPWNVAVGHDYIKSLLGIKIKPAEVARIFARLDLPAKQIKKKMSLFYEVKMPTRRGDLLTSEDLIEEIGRLYGYKNIPSKMPEGSLVASLENENVVYGDEIKDLLVGLGYSEIYNYSFISEQEKNLYGFDNLVELDNPLSQDQKYLRPNLAAGLIKNLKENLKYLKAGSGAGLSIESLRLFEIGNIFFREDKKVREQKKIGGLIFLKDARAKDAGFRELKGVIKNLFNRLGLADVWGAKLAARGLPENWREILNPARSGHIHSQDELLGWVGELNQKIAGELGVEKERPAIFEIDFEKIVKMVNEERIYQPPSKFPAVTRDLAILVGGDARVEDVVYEIETAAGELLQDSDLFDIYESDNSQSGQKSLAFHLIFQSNERNLSDSEVNKLMEKIIKVIEGKGWEVRK